MNQLDIPYAKGSDTSREAAESIADSLGPMENAVYLQIRLMSGILDTKGCTCYEIEQHLSMAHQTASARINGLKRKGLIKDSGKRRKTGSGRKAVVWVKA